MLYNHGYHSNKECSGFSKVEPQKDRFSVSCARPPPSPSLPWLNQSKGYSWLASEYMAKSHACFQIHRRLQTVHGMKYYQKAGPMDIRRKAWQEYPSVYKRDLEDEEWHSTAKAAANRNVGWNDASSSWEENTR